VSGRQFSSWPLTPHLLSASMLLLLLVLIALGHPEPCLASCRCAEPWPNAAEALARSAAVFRGRAELPPLWYDDGQTVTFAVSESWKGPATAKLSVHVGRGHFDCLYQFEFGREYLVYAIEDREHGLTAQYCWRTMRLDDAEEDLVALGPGQPVPPEPTALWLNWRTYLLGLMVLLVAVVGRRLIQRHE
jgi:hypothetical protein